MSIERNPGMDLNLDWIEAIQVNKSATERRAQSLSTRRSVKKIHQAAWLLKAITLIDLTTLAGDDTELRVKRLCAKAMNPLRHDLIKALDIEDLNITTGAICVYHDMLQTAAAALKGSGVHLAAVSTGFPAGLTPFHLKVEEINESVKAGADEIDIVITRKHVFSENWQALYDEVKAYREACGEAHMKTILATGEISTLRKRLKQSMLNTVPFYIYSNKKNLNIEMKKELRDILFDIFDN